MHRQERRQGHRLAWRTCQIEQSERKPIWGTARRLTCIKGLRSKPEATAEGEKDDDLKQLISVSLRPDDPFAKRLLSTAVTTNNILLKVTVPKRTGRKRKRGTSGPFLSKEGVEPEPSGSPNSHNKQPSKTYVNASTIFRSLQDNASTYKASIAGLVDETHRFRSEYPQLPSVDHSLTA